MTHIWIDGHSRLKRYTAVVNGAKSVVKIEIECSEPGSLGFLLEDLGRIQREQALKAKQEKAKQKTATTKMLALPAPPLQIADMREDAE